MFAIYEQRFVTRKWKIKALFSSLLLLQNVRTSLFRDKRTIKNIQIIFLFTDDRKRISHAINLTVKILVVLFSLQNILKEFYIHAFIYNWWLEYWTMWLILEFHRLKWPTVARNFDSDRASFNHQSCSPFIGSQFQSWNDILSRIQIFGGYFQYRP